MPPTGAFLCVILSTCPVCNLYKPCWDLQVTLWHSFHFHSNEWCLLMKGQKGKVREIVFKKKKKFQLCLSVGLGGPVVPFGCCVELEVFLRICKTGRKSIRGSVWCETLVEKVFLGEVQCLLPFFFHTFRKIFWITIDLESDS